MKFKLFYLLPILITASFFLNSCDGDGDDDVSTIREVSFETIRSQDAEGDTIYTREPSPSHLKDGTTLVMVDQDGDAEKYAPFSAGTIKYPSGHPHKHCNDRYFTGGIATNSGGFGEEGTINNLEYRKTTTYQFTLTSGNIDSSCVYKHPTDEWEYRLKAITYTFFVETIDEGYPLTGNYTTQVFAERVDVEFDGEVWIEVPVDQVEGIPSSALYGGNGTFTLTE